MTAITANRKPEHSFLLTTFWSFLVLIISTIGTAAETITVTNANDTGAGSLRQAVTDANFGDDTIVFDATFFSTPRTITLAADRINIRGNTTINGPGANLLTVSGGNISRIFDIESGRTVVISGMTLTEGNGQGFNFINNGGAILNQGTLTLMNMVVTGNQTGNGGGIYNDETGTLSVVNSTISNNVAFGFNSSGGGGGINNLGAVTVTGSVISGNTTVNEFDRPNNDGGGIRSELGSVTILNSTITGNSTRRNGGGIWISNTFNPDTIAALIIANSTISGNDASAESDFGQTGGNGGGIWLGSANTTINNSTLSGNTAANHGGVSFVGPGNLGIVNSTIASNTADNGGGGFGTFGGPEAATIRNTIIADNAAATAPDVQDKISSQGFNLIENIDGAIITDNMIGNITGIDPNLGPLQDNGGLTETHALLADSPAIDQGESSGETTDQRGFIRPIDDPDVADAAGGDGSDIGAFESSSEPAAVPGQVLNISTRLQVLTGDQVLIGGFIITGAEPKMVILRAIGPSLGAFGITDPLADPVLELRAANGSLITTNDNWTSNQAAIEATGLQPSDGLESAIVATLDPGSYTAIMSGKNGGTGVGLVEAYDLDPAAASELANISTRGFVATESNVMIGGFILGNETTVVVRAIGPTLSDFGVAGALTDPTLELRDVQGALVSSNDNWKDTQQDAIEESGLAPQDDLESAVLEALPAGAYTAIVAGQAGGTGVGLVEVYRLP